MMTTDGTVRSTTTTLKADAPSAPPARDARPGQPGPDVATPAQAQEVSTPHPVRPNAQLSRSQILDATEECLVNKGYDGTTIRRIAAILGCAVGSIYRYFTDKQQLLDAVVQRRFRPVLEHVRARQKAHRTAILYVQVAADQPELYRLMFWLSPGVTAKADGDTDAVGLPSIVEQIIDGWAAQLGSRQRAEVFWSQLHGQLMLGHNPTALMERLSQEPPPASPPEASTPVASTPAASTPAASTPAPPQPATPQPLSVTTEDVTLL